MMDKNSKQLQFELQYESESQRLEISNMAKDREHCKNWCKKMPFLNKNLPGTI